MLGLKLLFAVEACLLAGYGELKFGDYRYDPDMTTDVYKMSLCVYASILCIVSHYHWKEHEQT